MLSGTAISYFFIKHFGLYGAAVSSVISYYVNGVLLLHKSRKLLFLTVSEWIPWTQLCRIAIYTMISALSALVISLLSLNDISYLSAGTVCFFSILILLFIVRKLIL